jgi:hypothetical protein
MPVLPDLSQPDRLRTLRDLLAPYALRVAEVGPGESIPGSYWGDSEAGLVGRTLFVRPDTPVHSALHEACHFICMDDERRARLHTDAGGDIPEENAVCYLQGLLADRISGYDRAQLLADMDAWGYTFRLGSARAWFDGDADDARAWLQRHQLITPDRSPTGRLRQ